MTSATSSPAPAPAQSPAGQGPAGWSKLAERHRALQDGSLQPVTPKHAVTVVLLRDAPDAVAGSRLEAYLLRRVSTMAFAAGMHVFPGGSVDPRDAEGGGPAWTGPDHAAWAEALAADEALATSLVCAAVRETFEESGILLAGPQADSLCAAVTGPDWEADRQALVEHSVSLHQVLDRRGLVLRADLLRAWSHWITPELEPRRYDTRFLVAALPEGQATRHVGGEADHTTWVRPAQAVQAHQAGTLAMLPPTAVTLAEVGQYPDVAAVLEAAASRTITAYTPQVVIGPDGSLSIAPDARAGTG